MPNAFDPTLGGGGFPLSHNPLHRINVAPPKLDAIDLNDVIDAMQEWVANFLFPSIKRYTGIDLTPFLPLLNNVVDNLQLLFGVLDQEASTFDRVAAGTYLIQEVLVHTGLMATIEQIGEWITGIDAATGGQISQFFADIRYIIGDPLGLGTGVILIGENPFDIPLLAPVTGLVQLLIDAIVNALGYEGSGFNPANVLTYLGSVVGDVSGLVSSVAAFVAAVGGGDLEGAGEALSDFADEVTDLVVGLEAFVTNTGEATLAAIGTIINGLKGFLETIPADLIEGTLNGAVEIGGRALTVLVNNLDGAVDNIEALLTGAGEASMAALGNLIANLLEMLEQISAIFNGAAVTPINDTVSQIQTWFEANVDYLANIPNTAVQGLSGYGANLGASVQALSDGVWQGLRAFLGIPSGVGPPQVSSAAQQVRTDLNNASDIAAAAALFQAQQSITKQSYLSIDPSADPVFPLSNITGSSPTTVPVTQTKSVMGVIGLPDNGTKNTIQWFGGSLTNINAVYVNLYKVNTTTGEFTKTHASANLVGSPGLQNPLSGVAWCSYILPTADFFPTVQGDWYVAEIAVKGSGTYNVVGISNAWMPSHPTVFPKGLGATRTTDTRPTVRTVGTFAQATGSGSATANTTCNIAAGDYLVACTVDLGFNTSSVTVYCNGVAMTNLVSLLIYNSGGTTSRVQIWGTATPTTGSSVAVNAQCVATSANVSCQAMTLVGVSSVGATSTASGSAAAGGTMTKAAPVTPSNTTIITNFGAWVAGPLNTFTGGTVRGTTSGNIISGDAAGTGAAFNQTAKVTGTTSPYNWGAVSVIFNGIVGDPPVSIASPTYDAAVPWLALAGAAGRPQHLPETVEFEIAGPGQTYTVPEWVIDGDYIDIVPCGGGAGGSYIGNLGTPAYTMDDTYKGGGAGQWNPIRLRYGDDYDIPTGTTTFTVNVGAGGAGGAVVHSTHAPAHGVDGGDTTVVISGYPTITAAGGDHDGTTIDSGQFDFKGDTPGNQVHEGITYFGGVPSTTAGQAGTSPGGAGAAASSVHNPYTNYDTSGGPGAPGAAYITASQGA